MSDFGKFFLPGPTEVHPDVLRAMAEPVIGHRGAEMEALIGSVELRLRRLFRTQRPVYISTSSATGLMEAAIRNCVRSRVLCLVCGAFSERFSRIAQACGKEASVLDVEWGESNEPEAVADALARADYDALTVVHSETSTGVLNPVEEIAAVAREVAPDVLVIVDCVSSLAATPVEVDGWGIDFALTGSQKALAMPPGLAFGVASQRAYDRSLDVQARGLYFSFEAFERAMAKRQPANTPAVSLFYAMKRQLERVESEGLQARWARHRAMAERVSAWIDEVASGDGPQLDMLAAAGRRSPSVSCVLLPDTLDGADIARRARERGFTIAPGYGKLRERSIRIGHMGERTVAELEALLSVLGSILSERG